MSQLRRRIQLPLLGAILLGLVASISLVACRRLTKKSASSGKVARHTVKKSAGDVLKYWTVDKMQGARGADLPTVDTVDQEKQHQHKSGPNQH
jgi:hypothetical protein